MNSLSLCEFKLGIILSNDSLLWNGKNELILVYFDNIQLHFDLLPRKLLERSNDHANFFVRYGHNHRQGDIKWIFHRSLPSSSLMVIFFIYCWNTCLQNKYRTYQKFCVVLIQKIICTSCFSSIWESFLIYERWTEKGGKYSRN